MRNDLSAFSLDVFLLPTFNDDESELTAVRS